MSIPVAYLSVILIWSTTPLAIQWSTVGSGFAFAVLARMAIGTLLSAALVTPVFALLLGNAANGEPITPRILLGAACITAGLAMHQWQAIAAASWHVQD